MRPKEINLAMDVQREVGGIPDVGVVYVHANPMLSGNFNEDEIELDMRHASQQSKSLVREIAGEGWEIIEGDEYWTLKADYYPKSVEDMLKVRDPTDDNDT